MIFRISVFICFVHCLIDGKDIYIDMEAMVGKSARVYVEYLDTDPHFCARDLLHGVSRDHICNVVIESNLQESIEVYISSKTASGKMFCFKDKSEQKVMPFFLVDKEQKNKIENGSLLYQNHNVHSPISKVIPLGMQVLKVQKYQIAAINFSANFTVLLKNLG